jgi:hypothetical protein
MAVTATVTENRTTGDGSEQHYAFTFHTLDTAHVKATVDGVAPSFTVALNGDQEASPGGTVTFGTAPALNSEVRIYRETAKTQSLSLTPYAKFPATALEGAFDKLALEVQDAQARIDQIKAPFLAGGSGDVTPNVGSQGRLGIYSNPSEDGSTVLGVVVKDPDPATTYSWRAVTGSTDFAGVEATLALHDQRLDALEAGGGGGTPVAGTEGYYVTGPGLDGLVGNGIANDGVALQAVLTSNPTRGILLKAGTYNIDGTVLTMSTGQVLAGEGRALTSLLQADADTSMIEMAESCELRDMSLIHDENVTPTSGDMIRVFGSSRTAYEKMAARISNLRLIAPWTGVRVDDGAVTPTPVGNATIIIGFFADDIVIQSIYNAGFLFRDVADAHINRAWIDGGTGANGQRGDGIRIEGFSEGIECSGVETLSCNYGAALVGTAAGGNDGREVVAGCLFNNCYFDSCANHGVYLSVAQKNTFSGCWFAGNAFYGACLDDGSGSVYGNKFVGCQFLRNGLIGLRVLGDQSTALHLSVTGCQFGEHVAEGINIESNNTHFIIQGNTFTNQVDAAHSTAGNYGVVVQVGASDYYVIADNIFQGQTSGTIQDLGSGSNKRVANNY